MKKLNNKINQIKQLRKESNTDYGFTLIELLVVILIIAILAAVGIVALLGAIRSGQESASKTTLSQANTEIRALIANNGGSLPGNTSASAQQLQNESKDIQFSTDTIQGTDYTNQVAITVRNAVDAEFIIATQSKSGKCFYLTSANGEATKKYYKDAPSSGNCSSNVTSFDNSYTSFK